MPAELKPCPFCGGEAELIQKGNDGTRRRSITVRCVSCRIQLTNGAIYNNMKWLIDLTTNQWNRRAEIVDKIANDATTAAATPCLCSDRYHATVCEKCGEVYPD